MKKWLWLLVGASLVMGQQKLVKQIQVSDQNGQENKKEVTIKVEDGNAQVVVTKDGDTEKFEFPIDQLKDDEIQKKLADMGVDTKDLDPEDFQPDSDNYAGNFPFNFSSKFHPKAFLGVQLQDLTDQLRSYFKMKGDGGALVSEVVDDSPADKAKLKAGDIILQVNDTRISDPEELKDVIGKMDPGTKVEITYLRSGRERTTTAALKEPDATQFGWFGGSFPNLPNMKNMPMIPGMSHQYMLFNHDNDNNDPDALQQQMDSMKKEIESLKKQLDSMQNQ